MIRFERVERIGGGGGGGGGAAKLFYRKVFPPLPKPHLSLSKDF